ncbi:ribose-phosphate diphosphokinase [Candidatus Woesearchaeota archaeon]|nr:ribose-phosphate diphosphokinase [Candidatus Woesearchaeota archaeon]
MIIIGLSHGLHVAKKIAKLLKRPYSKLEASRFPDSETYMRFHCDVRGQQVVLVQSFYGDVNNCLMEVFFAAWTAKDLGARKVILAAPFFPYFRQDARFNPGECVSLQVIAKFVDDCVDAFFVIDPHLHREKNLGHIFKVKAHKITANPLMMEYIKKHVKNPLIVGPDWESYKWAQATAKMIGCESVILEKTRYNSRDVRVKLSKNIDISKNNLVLVDDMISTGHTLLETIKLLKGMGAKKFTCVTVHGIFAEGALEKLEKTGAKVAACNTIPGRCAKIDVSGLLADALRHTS